MTVMFMGIASPLESTLTIESSTIDLTTVTAVSWEVTLPGGDVTTWPATLGAATPTSLVTHHMHAPGDVPRRGAYRLRALLSTAAGVVPSAPVSTTVTY